MKGFGCRPGVSDRPGDEGRRPKASEEGTRGTAVSGWPSMGIWRGSGLGEGMVGAKIGEGRRAADGCGLAAAAAVDGADFEH